MTDAPARPKLLIVEDEVELRGALLEMLEGAGYEVVGIADNGLDAITLAERVAPDLMLVDYRMPGADGVTLTRAVKRSAPATQILMFTAFEEASLSEEALRSGVFAVLVKGCRPSLIVETLSRAWDQRRALDDPSAAGPGVG